MQDPDVLKRMRADWNRRASEDAYYYAAFGRREQDAQEFFASAAYLVQGLEAELKRLPVRTAALEIGCGPGRLMRPLSRWFEEIHGVDVSDEMIGRARELLRDTPNAHLHRGSGSDLSLFGDNRFDFVYSYAVFQHIPSREVVWQYLRDARRVLKPGGVLRCQLNGLPPGAKHYDTWSGVSIAPDEVRAFARDERLQLMAVEDIWTQYMWITCRKPDGREAMGDRGRPAAIHTINKAFSGETAVPDSGPQAALSLYITDLPLVCDLDNISVHADGLACRPVYVGPRAPDWVTQVNVILPHGIRTGLVPVEVEGPSGLRAAGRIRIVPAGPAVPRIKQITDGVNLLMEARTASGILKVIMRDLARGGEFAATIDGRPLRALDSFCTDQTRQTWEFNLHLPHGTAPGRHELRIKVGHREFAPVAIEVV